MRGLASCFSKFFVVRHRCRHPLLACFGGVAVALCCVVVLGVGAVAVLAVAAALRASRPWLCSAASGGAADRMCRATPDRCSLLGVAPGCPVFSDQAHAASMRAPRCGLPLFCRQVVAWQPRHDTVVPSQVWQVASLWDNVTRG